MNKLYIYKAYTQQRCDAGPTLKQHCFNVLGRLTDRHITYISFLTTVDVTPDLKKVILLLLCKTKTQYRLSSKPIGLLHFGFSE